MSSIIFQPAWRRKPLKPEFDLSHPVVKNCTSLLSFDRVNANGAPWDDAAKVFWATATTYGTTPYKKQPLNGSMNLVRQDMI